MKLKDNSKISILIVPHTKKVKRLLIPQWLPKATLLLFSTLFLISFTYLGNTYISQSKLKQERDEKISIINDLETKNNIKDIELAKLKSINTNLNKKTVEVDEKLSEIDVLQKKLERMADIKSPSRGGSSRESIHTESIDPDEDMEIIKEVLEDKVIELEVFIDDVENKFESLKSIPNSRPTNGRLTSKFGNRSNPFGRGYQFHYGIDIANSRNTKIFSAGKGVVIFSGYKGGYGRTIIIDHGNGYKTLYAHNNSLLVNRGDKVEKKQLIAKMGSTGSSTGNHLHFEIHRNDQPINPYDILSN